MKKKVNLQQIVWRFREARERLQPSIELRRNYLTAVYHQQLASEKAAIQGHIGSLAPGVRKVYLQNRLAELNSRLGR